MNDGKRVTSTARRLKYMWFFQLMGIFLSFDIMILMSGIVILDYNVQKNVFGDFSFKHYGDSFDTENEKLIYIYSKKQPEVISIEDTDNIDGNYLLIRIDTTKETIVVETCKDRFNEKQDITLAIKIIAYIFIAMLVIEACILLEQLFKTVTRIRKQLKPLDDMIQTANYISQMALDEKQIHEFENAIARVSPTNSGFDGRIHTTDEELKPLENAVNNLIERMRESYRMQSRFVSDASHELRTPIAVIQGYANMLDRWGKSDEQILDESIQAIKNESDQMKKLVEQLLFLARGDSGRQQMNMETINLYDLLKEVYDESVMIDEQHNYILSGEKDVTITGDVSMIKQTARILVDNAAKYTLTKDDIKLSCGRDEHGKAYFYISDSGIGMSESDVCHVFERFYRADSARDKKTGGTGLGLSIAKWIVDRHNGHFEVVSREEIGTRIKVVFD